MTTNDDYEKILPVLKRMLECGQRGTGCMPGWEQVCGDEPVYLGEALFSVRGETSIASITDDPERQERLRDEAKAIGVYKERGDSYWTYEADLIDFDFIVRTSVHIPLPAMSKKNQALYQMRTLLVNNYDWGGHEWAVAQGYYFSYIYGDTKYAVLGKEWDVYPANDRIDWSPIIELLQEYDVDLKSLGVCIEDGYNVEIHGLESLEWVEANDVHEELFPNTNAWDGSELNNPIACAIDGLAAERPDGDPPLVYLHDLPLVSFDQVKSDLWKRMYGIPQLISFAAEIEQGETLEEVNAVVQRLYKEAKALHVWVV